MSPFTVYLVMQADSFVFGAGFLGFVFLIVGVLVWPGEVEERGYTRSNPGFLLGLIGILSMLLAIALPSTKTAAAMLVIPAITSDKALETISPEVREVWELAKGALKQASEKEKKVTEVEE